MEFVPAIVAATFVAFALVSRRLGRTAITGPMVFVALGLVLGPEVLDLFSLQPSRDFELVDLLLEATLVVVLFTDASAINSSHWRDEAAIPGRLLSIGLPLAIGAGWVLALVLLGELGVWEAAVLATMLAPTDAALGKAVVSNPRVPQRIRQALNVESGLNDGIALPVFVVFLEAARAAEESVDPLDFLEELAPEVGIAIVVGLGWAGPAPRQSAAPGTKVGHRATGCKSASWPSPSSPSPSPIPWAGPGSSRRGWRGSPSGGSAARPRTTCTCSPRRPATCSRCRASWSSGSSWARC